MQRFGEIVRAAILAKGLTLEHVANGMSSHKGYVSGICTGTLNPPSPKMIVKLCDILGLSYDHMLALSAFEKLPKGMKYRTLEAVLIEARVAGLVSAPGKAKGWKS